MHVKYDGNMDSEIYQHMLGTTYMGSLVYYGMDKSSVIFNTITTLNTSQSLHNCLVKQQCCKYIDDWPAQHPDLNPIGHVWHQIKLNLSLYETWGKERIRTMGTS